MFLAQKYMTARHDHVSFDRVFTAASSGSNAVLPKEGFYKVWLIGGGGGGCRALYMFKLVYVQGAGSASFCGVVKLPKCAVRVTVGSGGNVSFGDGSPKTGGNGGASSIVATTVSPNVKISVEGGRGSRIASSDSVQVNVGRASETVIEGAQLVHTFLNANGEDGAESYGNYGRRGGRAKLATDATHGADIDDSYGEGSDSWNDGYNAARSGYVRIQRVKLQNGIWIPVQ